MNGDVSSYKALNDIKVQKQIIICCFLWFFTGCSSQHNSFFLNKIIPIFFFLLIVICNLVVFRLHDYNNVKDTKWLNLKLQIFCVHTGAAETS